MTCPECGSEMVKRKGKHGEFMGCKGYPDCTHTAPLGPTGPIDESDRKSALKAYGAFISQKGWTEAQGSKWLQQTMGLNWDEARINNFDKKQCELLVAYIKLENTAGGESEIAIAMRKAQTRRKQ